MERAAIYTSRAFVETDLAHLDALVARDAFVTLVTIGRDGAPSATHLPILYCRDGDAVLIEGHWAKPNPQATHGDTALMIVHGPHAYVSPDWYPDRDVAARVPTWNYAAAHLSGTLERFDDEAALIDIVARTSVRFEDMIGGGWRFQPERQDQRTQVRGIVGFRFVPTRIEMKFKLNQNHPAANRHAVAAALSGSARDDDRAIAALMRAREP